MTDDGDGRSRSPPEFERAVREFGSWVPSAHGHLGAAIAGVAQPVLETVKLTDGLHRPDDTAGAGPRPTRAER